MNAFGASIAAFVARDFLRAVLVPCSNIGKDVRQSIVAQLFTLSKS
jgi:hypothetical protein